MTASRILGDSLTAEILSVETSVVEDFLVSHYGINATPTQLTAERDCNFVMRTASGEQYVLKIANPAESRSFINLQTEALRHIQAKSPAFPVQRVLPTLDGAFELELQVSPSKTAIARLFTYVPGEVLRFSNRTAPQRRNLGRILAELGLILRDFDHPGAAHKIAWDIQHAGELRDLVPEATGEPTERALVLRCLDAFDERVASRLRSFRKQIVHNDLNRNNAIVDAADHDKIVAILDFGDMTRTALINDVAIAAANQLDETDNPLDGAADFVAGYRDVTPLLPDELETLIDLIITRVMMSVIITSWRAARFPHNRAHITRNTPANWRRLSLLTALPRAQATSILSQAREGA
jgi:hydroxylysine kinase